MTYEYTIIFFLVVSLFYFVFKYENAKHEALLNHKLKLHFENEFFTVLRDIEASMEVVDSKRFLKQRLNRRADDILKKLIEGVEHDDTKC